MGSHTRTRPGRPPRGCDGRPQAEKCSTNVGFSSLPALCSRIPDPVPNLFGSQMCSLSEPLCKKDYRSPLIWLATTPNPSKEPISGIQGLSQWKIRGKGGGRGWEKRHIISVGASAGRTPGRRNLAANSRDSNAVSSCGKDEIADHNLTFPVHNDALTALIW